MTPITKHKEMILLTWSNGRSEAQDLAVHIKDLKEAIFGKLPPEAEAYRAGTAPYLAAVYFAELEAAAEALFSVFKFTTTNEKGEEVEP